MLRRQINESELSSIKTSAGLQPSVWQSIKEKRGNPYLAAFHAQLAAVDRRKCNLIVSEIQPSDDLADPDLFTVLCEEHLPVKPVMLKEKCLHLVKKLPDKIQPLLIVLESEVNVAEVLRYARRLQNTDNSSTIYVNRDLIGWHRRKQKRHPTSGSVGEKKNKEEEEKKQKDDDDEWQPESKFSSNVW